MGRRLADGTLQDECLDKVKPGEPIFVLRAQDLVAPAAVRFWAKTARIAAVVAEGSVSDRLAAKIAEAERHADEMEAWQAEHATKVPD